MDELDIILGIIYVLFRIITYPIWFVYKFIEHNFLKKSKI
jgi:hypothetical protein